jgi:hypothetical protein
MVPNNRKTHTGEYLRHSAKLALVCAGVAEGEGDPDCPYCAQCTRQYNHQRYSGARPF